MSTLPRPPQPPVPTPTPGAGTSFSPDVVDELIHNQALFLQAWAFYQQVVAFFAALHSWQSDAIQSVANNQPIRPAPIPPAGFTIPPHLLDPPALPTDPSQNQTNAPSNTVVEPKSQFGTYPAPFDTNKPGTIIPNPYIPGGQLRKVASKNPFGTALWWEEV